MNDRVFVCYYWLIGFTHISFGLHVALEQPNIEIHLPFGFLRIGWELPIRDRNYFIGRAFGWGHDEVARGVKRLVVEKPPGLYNGNALNYFKGEQRCFLTGGVNLSFPLPQQKPEPQLFGFHTTQIPNTGQITQAVGHKTFIEKGGVFRHEPLTRGEADKWLAQADAEDKARKELMPDEATAITMLCGAHHRLKELGWNDACYCPKDGSEFLVLEPGSTGQHICVYSGEWPKGSYWIQDAELGPSPSSPILFKPLPAAPVTADELERLAKAATPGPWCVPDVAHNDYWEPVGKFIAHASEGGIKVAQTTEGFTGAHEGPGIDAQFITALANHRHDFIRLIRAAENTLRITDEKNRLNGKVYANTELGKALAPFKEK